jgi:hypothetical protein
MDLNANTQREKYPAQRNPPVQNTQISAAERAAQEEGRIKNSKSVIKTAPTMRFSLGAHFPTARKISLSATQKRQGTKRDVRKFSVLRMCGRRYCTSCYLPVSKCVMHAPKEIVLPRGRDKSSFITTRLLSCELMEAHSHSASASDNTLPQSPGTGHDLKTS